MRIASQQVLNRHERATIAERDAVFGACMPEDDYAWLPREDVLQFEETGVLVEVFVALGVDTIRLTGGEPLLRRTLPALVRTIAAKRD